MHKNNTRKERKEEMLRDKRHLKPVWRLERVNLELMSRAPPLLLGFGKVDFYSFIQLRQQKREEEGAEL